MPASPLTRRLLESALALTVVAASAIASADPGTVVLVSGQVVVGEVQQVVQGEYIILKLPTGEMRAIAWAQIGSFQIGASGSVSTGNPPAPAPAPAPAQPPPPTVYAPPPPPPNYYAAPPPPPPPVPAASFQPAWMLGVRLGSMIPSGYLSDNSAGNGTKTTAYAGTGWSIEGNLGIHFSPAWTFYGFWEHGQLGRGELNSAAPDNTAVNTLGVGINANTNPRGPVGLFVDLALGYRWFTFSQTNISVDQVTGTTTSSYDRIVAEGLMPIRFGLGLSIQPTRKFRIDVAAQFSGGSFSRYKGGACPDGCSIDESNRGTHILYGLVAGARWDL